VESGPHNKWNTQVYEEACEWFLEFRVEEPDAAARSRFDAWMRRSPEHVAAYLEVAAVWGEPASHDQRKKWDAQVLIEEAAAEPENVVPLPQTQSSESQSGIAAISTRLELTALRSQTEPPANAVVLPKVRRSNVLRWPPAIAASVTITLILAGIYIWRTMHTPAYSTSIGEQRLIELADGSTLELNARTKLVVRYSDRERNVELLAGQALFHVARDPARPFTVVSEGMRVRAVGTQFDINKKRGNTVVTVVEGRIAVDASFDSSQPRGVMGGESSLLAAGEQLVVASHSQQKPAHPDVAGATAWLRRKIVFDAAPLSEVADEFNRYSARQLIIEGSAVNAVRVSGVFSSTDIGSVIRFIRERPGLQVTETAGEIRVRKNNS